MNLVLAAAISVSVVAIAVVGRKYQRFRTSGTDMSFVEFVVRLAKGGDFGEIGVARLAAMLESPDPPILVDLRTPARFAADHIEGAVGRPMDEFLKDVVVHERYAPDDRLVLICDTGHMSRVSAAILVEDEGFTDVTNVKGGMEAWQRYRDRACRRTSCCRLCRPVG